MAEGDLRLSVVYDVNDSDLQRKVAQSRALAERTFGSLKVGSPNLTDFNRGISNARGNFNQLTEASDDFGDSLERGLRRITALSIASAALFGIARAFTASITAAKELEKNLQNINVILNLPSDQLAKFGNDLFNVARNTKQSFEDVAKAATEFSRQGLGVEETLKRTQAALILVNLAGVSATQGTEAITAAINSFSKESLSAIDIVNKLVAVDAKFAVSSADLAEAITRVGSTAQDAGVDFNRLLSIVTSTQQITQRGGAVIGNALKTIFQRIQRPEVLEQLERLGIQVRETDRVTGQYTGNLLSADKVLRQLGVTFKDLNQEQRAQVSELVGGVLQGNILRGVLNGLAFDQAAYETALKSTDEAIRRNALLLETQDAKLKQVGTSLQQLGANVGKVGLGDFINDLLGGLTTQTGGITSNLLGGLLKNLSGQGSEIGNEFGKVFIKGFSDILLGPGLLTVGIIGIRIVQQLKKFTEKSLGGLSPFSEKDAAIQQQIGKFIGDQFQKIQAINASTADKITKEEQILNLFRAQNVQLAEQNALAASTAAILTKGGVGRTIVRSTGGPKIRNAADGVTEAFVRENNAISKGVGGATSSAKPVFLPNFKFNAGMGIVANTDEFLVPNHAGSGMPAIFNKDMVRKFGLPNGARRISAAEGVAAPPPELTGLFTPEGGAFLNVRASTTAGFALRALIGQKIENITPENNPFEGTLQDVLKRNKKIIREILKEKKSLFSFVRGKPRMIRGLASGFIPNFPTGLEGLTGLFTPEPTDFGGKIGLGNIRDKRILATPLRKILRERGVKDPFEGSIQDVLKRNKPIARQLLREGKGLFSLVRGRPQIIQDLAHGYIPNTADGFPLTKEQIAQLDALLKQVQQKGTQGQTFTGSQQIIPRTVTLQSKPVGGPIKPLTPATVQIPTIASVKQQQFGPQGITLGSLPNQPSGLPLPNLPQLSQIRATSKEVLSGTGLATVKKATKAFGEVGDVSQELKRTIELQTRTIHNSIDVLNSSNTSEKQKAAATRVLTRTTTSLKENISKTKTIGGTESFQQLISSRSTAPVEKESLKGVENALISNTNAQKLQASIQRSRDVKEITATRIDEINATLARNAEARNLGRTPSNFAKTIETAVNNPILRLEKALISKGLTLSPSTISKFGGAGTALAFAAPFAIEGAGALLTSGERDQVTRERKQRGFSTAATAASTAGLLASVAPALGPIGGTVALGAAGIVAAGGALKGFFEGTTDSAEDTAKRVNNLASETQQRIQAAQSSLGGLARIQQLREEKARPEDITGFIKEALRAAQTIESPGVRGQVKNLLLQPSFAQADLDKLNTSIQKFSESEQRKLVTSAPNVTDVFNKVFDELKTTRTFLPRLGKTVEAREGLNQATVNALTEIAQANLERGTPEETAKAIGGQIAKIQGVSPQISKLLSGAQIGQFQALGGPADEFVIQANEQQQQLREDIISALSQGLTKGQVQGAQKGFDIIRTSQDIQEVNDAIFNVGEVAKATVPGLQNAAEANLKLKKSQQEYVKSIDLGNVILERSTKLQLENLKARGQFDVSRVQALSAQQGVIQLRRQAGAGESELQNRALQDAIKNLPIDIAQEQKEAAQSQAASFAKFADSQSTLTTFKTKLNDPNAEKLLKIIKSLNGANNLDETSATIQSLIKELTVLAGKSGITDNELADLTKGLGKFNSDVELINETLKNNAALQGAKLQAEQEQGVNARLSFLSPEFANIAKLQSQARFVGGQPAFGPEERGQRSQETLGILNAVSELAAKTKVETPGVAKAIEEVTKQGRAIDVELVDKLITQISTGGAFQGSEEALKTLREIRDAQLNQQKIQNNLPQVEQIQAAGKARGIDISVEDAIKLLDAKTQELESAATKALSERLNVQRGGEINFSTPTPTELAIEDIKKLDIFKPFTTATELVSKTAEDFNTGRFVESVDRLSVLATDGIPLTIKGEKIEIGSNFAIKVEGSDELSKTVAEIVNNTVIDALGASDINQKLSDIFARIVLLENGLGKPRPPTT